MLDQQSNRPVAKSQRQLERATRMTAFPSRIREGIDRSNEIIVAIESALANGWHTKAKELATGGAKQYPANIKLMQYAKALNPPRARQANSPPDPTILDSQDWITKHRDDFMGRWVALQNGDLVASAETAKELKEKTGSWKGLFITKVT